MCLNNFSKEYLNTILDDGLTIREHIEQGHNNAKEYYKNIDNTKFHRSPEEQNISFQFFQKYNRKIKSLEKKIYLPKNNTIKYNENNTLSILIAIFKCEKSIFFYNKLKNFCYNNNGKIYFQDYWKYCHNSQYECFEYIEIINNIKLQLIKLLKNKKG